MEKDFLKNYYFRVLELAFIISLIIFILIFYFSEKSNVFVSKLPVVKITTLTMVEIPRTIQRVKRKPQPLKPRIPIASDEVEILDEVEIDTGDMTGDPIGINNANSKEFFSEARQVFETVPQDTENRISGHITLYLKIGKDGRVKEYKIEETSLSDSSYSTQVISAILKSRWKPAVKNGKPVETWVMKTYSFDN